MHSTDSDRALGAPLSTAGRVSSASDDNAQLTGKRIVRAITETSTKRRRRRKHKPTHLLQKEKRDQLVAEIKILEARTELLRARLGVPTAQDRCSLGQLQAENDKLDERLHAHRMHLHRCQAILHCEMNTRAMTSTRSIQLPRNLPERQDLLRSMKPKCLQRAQDLVIHRLDTLDPLKAYTNEERFEDATGMYHCKRCDLLQFHGHESAKVVFDALLFVHANIEICVSQMLGHLSIREDSDDFDPMIWNHRVITSTSGYTEESNVVGFAAYEKSVHSIGIVAFESVEHDDLYPYKPLERIRKDISAAYTVSEHRHPTTHEVVIVLKRCVCVTVHPPQLELPSQAFETIREQITTWALYVIQLIREHIAAGRSQNDLQIDATDV